MAINGKVPGGIHYILRTFPNVMSLMHGFLRTLCFRFLILIMLLLARP